jgi:hypothetical protein
MQMSNILQSEFYDKLWIHQVPQSMDFSDSFRHDYNCYRSNKEDVICDAIKYYSYDLVDYITNPSEKVIIAAIARSCSYFNKIKDPTPNMIVEYFCHSFYIDKYNQYSSQLTDKHINHILSRNIEILPYIENPTEDQCWMALRCNIHAIKYIKKQTVKMCEFVTCSSNNNYGISYSSEELINSLQYFNDNIIKNILYNWKLSKYFYLVPSEYHTFKNILIVINHDSDFIQYLIHPSHTSPKINLPLTQDLCNIVFNQSMSAIKFIPEEFQTEAIKLKIIEYNIYLYQE